MELKLDDDARRDAEQAIKRFFEDELDQDIGDLKARTVADFFYEQLAPLVYRQAIADAEAYLQERLLDMGAVLQLGRK